MAQVAFMFFLGGEDILPHTAKFWNLAQFLPVSMLPQQSPAMELFLKALKSYSLFCCYEEFFSGYLWHLQKSSCSSLGESVGTDLAEY